MKRKMTITLQYDLATGKVDLNERGILKAGFVGAADCAFRLTFLMSS